MSRTALIVIDVQESFRVRPNWQAVNHPDIADRVGRLVRAARDKGDLVVWVLHSEPGTGGAFDPANGHVRLIEGLEPADGEPMITKTSHNAFSTTNLQQQLTQHGVTELVISGIRTEQCCETTTRHASDEGFEVDFVPEATLTFEMRHLDGSPLPAADIVARTSAVLSGRFATICSVEQALARAA